MGPTISRVCWICENRSAGEARLEMFESFSLFPAVLENHGGGHGKTLSLHRWLGRVKDFPGGTSARAVRACVPQRIYIYNLRHRTCPIAVNVIPRYH